MVLGFVTSWGGGEGGNPASQHLTANFLSIYKDIYIYIQWYHTGGLPYERGNVEIWWLVKIGSFLGYQILRADPKRIFFF